MEITEESKTSSSSNKTNQQPKKPFTLKRWNLIATWAWDVECDTCAICRVHLMEACLRCQSESKAQECVVIWGECNHCFHLCGYLGFFKNVIKVENLSKNQKMVEYF
uniref:Zinc finger RING-H2-type domain-containing protein n=1 Tax=Meloidogyne enterolobii TaxID=390850 RepID=A0A6V7Y146_MELEN|nr:unnamed protein product [Meloidogyne enterolobii]